jgi:sRNA-binding protein
MDSKIKTHSPSMPAKQPIERRQRSPRPPWMEANLADWRKRWPAVFTKPVPLAIGISGQMKAVLRAEDKGFDLKQFGMSIHSWTLQSAYLHAVLRGEMRRNLDGSETDVPNEEARQQAKQLLDERLVRRKEREQRDKERKQLLAAGGYEAAGEVPSKTS